MSGEHYLGYKNKIEFVFQFSKLKKQKYRGLWYYGQCYVYYGAVGTQGVGVADGDRGRMKNISVSWF